MLLRISLIVAIVAGLGVAVLGYLEISDKIPALVKQREDENSAKHVVMNQLAITNRILVKTKSELASTQQELADTKSERDKAQAAADTAQHQVESLTDKLAKATQERDDAQNNLASYTATGLTAAQVGKLNHDLKDANAELAAITDEKIVLQHVRDKLLEELSIYREPNHVVQLPANLRGKVVTVDPKWEFVVLNIGEDQGLKDRGEMLVSRDGRLIGKVIVRTLQKDRSIANFVPGWELGQITEGDLVSPAHPAS